MIHTIIYYGANVSLNCYLSFINSIKLLNTKYIKLYIQQSIFLDFGKNYVIDHVINHMINHMIFLAIISCD